jgi:hypothetical protein
LTLTSLRKGDPTDTSIKLRPLEPASGQALARDLVLKTRRRKGLSDSIAVSKYLEDEVCSDFGFEKASVLIAFTSCRLLSRSAPVATQICSVRHMHATVRPGLAVNYLAIFHLMTQSSSISTENRSDFPAKMDWITTLPLRWNGRWVDQAEGPVTTAIAVRLEHRAFLVLPEKIKKAG